MSTEPSATDPASQPKQTIGRFEVLSFIGTSNTGDVYRVKDPENGAVRAVKVLDARHLERSGDLETIRNEVRALAALDHPNVVRTLESHLDEEPFYLVMEFMPGGPLRSILRRRRLSFTETFGIFKDVCQGLTAAHRQGITHRELGPHNVMLTDDFSLVKLADFGLGALHDFAERVSESETGTFDSQRLAYLAPEYLQKREADSRSDVYSAGVLLYEALTGRTPQGRFALPSQLNSNVPSEVDPIVLRCLATDPNERYRSGRQLLRDILELEERLRLGLVQNLQGLTRPAEDDEERERESRPAQIGLVAIAVLLLVLVGMTVFWRFAAPAPTEATLLPAGPAGARQDLAVIERKIDSGLLESAGDDLGAFLEAHGEGPLALSGQLLRARLYARDRDLEALRVAAVEIDTRYEDDPRIQEARLELGRELLALGESAGDDEALWQAALLLESAAAGDASVERALRAISAESRHYEEAQRRMEE